MARDKSVLTPIVLGAESAGGTATLTAVPVSAISTTAFYGCPDVIHLYHTLNVTLIKQIVTYELQFKYNTYVTNVLHCVT